MIMMASDGPLPQQNKEKRDREEKKTFSWCMQTWQASHKKEERMRREREQENKVFPDLYIKSPDKFEHTYFIGTRLIVGCTYCLSYTHHVIHHHPRCTTNSWVFFFFPFFFRLPLFAFSFLLSLTQWYVLDSMCVCICMYVVAVACCPIGEKKGGAFIKCKQQKNHFPFSQRLPPGLTSWIRRAKWSNSW